MAMLLKQSTAVDVLIGPFLDKTDALTAETGESPAVKLSKNGQALGAKNDATTPVHDDDGYYNCELDATDTDTVGTLVLTVIGSANALPVRHEFQVVEQDTFTYLYADGAAPDTQVAAIKTDTAAILADTGTDGVIVASLAADSITAAVIAADAIGASELDADAATEIANAVWDTDATGRQTGGTFGQAIGDPGANAETMYDAVVTDAAGTNIAIDVIAVKTETALIVADTDVIDDGTSGLVKIASDVAAVLADTGTDGVVVNASSLATDAVNEIVDQVWNEARSDHTTDGSTGQAMRKLLDIDVDDTTAANAGSGLGQIDDIQTDTGVIGAAGAGLTDLGGMATGMKNEVNAEVDTALDTTISELSQGIPATTPTVRTALMLLYMALRNKLDVNTTASPDVLEVHNDAGTIIAKKDLTDDGTDYSEAKMASGA